MESDPTVPDHPNVESDEDQGEIEVEVIEPEASDGTSTDAEEIAAEPTPKERIATLEKAKQETYERLLRSAADFENYRKRALKDKDDARNRGREEVLREMLPVVDNLERALEAAAQSTGDVASVIDGVNLVLKQFVSSLDRLGVAPFASAGEVFDPSKHEAISQIETDESEAGTVVTEMQKGYMMGKRLLRPAMVVVAKALAQPAAPVANNGAAEILSVDDEILSVDDETLSVDDETLSVDDETLSVDDETLSVDDETLSVDDASPEPEPEEGTD